jgi:hypothetical protein
MGFHLMDQKTAVFIFIVLGLCPHLFHLFKTKNVLEWWYEFFKKYTDESKLKWLMSSAMNIALKGSAIIGFVGAWMMFRSLR